MCIIGAGLSGCLAALMIPGSEIYEPLEKPKVHQALLRFRSDRIGKAVGIPFKKVVVHKGIWHNNTPVQLAPKYIIRYARKVSSAITARSIVNQEPVERWIAPIDFHQQMLNMLDVKSINLSDIILAEDHGVVYRIVDGPLISTVPMNVLNDTLGIDNFQCELVSQKIYVSKFGIEDCDIHMTNYYTGTDTPVYRASLSGNELIVESSFPIVRKDMDIIKASFGLDGIPLHFRIENFEQSIGKINPIDEQKRKAHLYRLTRDYNIYSLGRFAIWKNIVMDDVYNDILRIKEWVHKSDYDRVKS